MIKALLLADTEGSVRLWEADRESAKELFTRLDHLVATAAEAHRADRPLEQGEGDSFILVLADAAAAARAALDLQRAIIGDLGLKVRMAIHVGEVEKRPDGRYAGPIFNRASRLRALAHGGQVLLTRAAADQARPRLPEQASLADLGEHRLRDLATPERVWQLAHPDLPDDFPPILSLSALPNNLPPQQTTFVGRHEEIEQLTALLATARLVTLTGAGGCGKTRLAVHVAAEVSDAYRDGVWWVDLAPIADPALVPATIARTLGIGEIATDDITTAIERAIKDKHLLLVLDNCEHVIDATARLAERVTTHNTVLATSREPLGLAGEHAYRVPSLPPEEATALFADRATRMRPTFRLDDETRSSVEEICTRLDGIPLAIELAAARTRMMSPKQILAAIEDRFHVLTGGARTALPRQRTLEASVDWSYRLLGDAEKELLARLSVFAGTFDLGAAEAVGADDEDGRYRILDVLGSLVDRSLVHVETDGDSDRYRLLETIRAYARQRLADSGDMSATRTRHLDHYLALAEAAEPELEGSDAPTWFVKLDAELDNLRAALDWGLASDDPEKVLRLAGSIWALWWMRGAGAEIGRPLHAALEAEGIDPSVRVKGLMAAEAIAFYAGHLATARRYGSEAVDLALSSGDVARGSRALVWLAWSYTWLEPTAARAHFEKGIALAEETGSDRMRALFAYGLGFQKVVTGSVAEGEQDLRTGVEVASRLGDSTEGHALAWLGASLWVMGRLEEAEAVNRRGYEISRAHGDMMFTTSNLLSLALTLITRGDLDAVRTVAPELNALARSPGFPVGEVWARFVSAWLTALSGDLHGAAAAFGEIVVQSRNFGMEWGHWVILPVAAEILLALGNVSEAQALATEARDGGARLRMPHNEGTAHVTLSRIALAASDPVTAEDRAFTALTLLGPVQGRVGIVEALELAACSTDRPVNAARLFGAASAARERLRYARARYNEPLHAEHRERVRAALGSEAFDAAFDEGSAMSLEDATAFALRGRGARGRPTAGWDSLTPAELSVVVLVAQGLTNPEIASKLLCSRNTVKAHLAHVFAKLSLSTRAELAAEATRRGL